MRSGPATRTAFCQREFIVLPFDTAKGCLIRIVCQPSRDAAWRRLFEADSQLRSACAPESAPPLIASAGCSLAMRDRFLRRPQRPGLPNACTFGNRSAAYPFGFSSDQAFQLAPTLALGKTAAEPAFAITGSVKFTPAVIAISRIRLRSAIRINAGAVRKLWTLKLPCGRWRKKRKKFRLYRKDDEGARLSTPLERQLLSCIADPPNRAGAVVADQQRSIFCDGDSHRSPPDVSVCGDEACQEVFILV
jgi:hypothetical protein